MFTASCIACVLLGGIAVAQPQPITLVEWTFDGDTEGWTGSATSPLKVEDGALVFTATGSDVLVVSPLFELTPELGDVLQIRLKSTTAGTAEWFWRPTTEGRYGGFGPELRRSIPIEESDDWHTLCLQPFWQASERIVGVRFDPPEGLAGTYAIDHIRIVRYPRGEPVECDFDFTEGPKGWVSPHGTATSVAEGLQVVLPTSGSRIMSPQLDLDATANAYLFVDLTAPAEGSLAGTHPAVIEFIAAGSDKLHSVSFRAAAGQRGRYHVHMSQSPGWRGQISAVLLGLGTGRNTQITLHGLRAAARPEGGVLDDPATGLEFQTRPWRNELRLAAPPPRIDVATQAPPPTRPVESDYTVAMWYFAAWEPEYTWDGWKQVAERSPWRIPLLYDSEDAEMLYNGIHFYRASNPRVIDWHVHWMREHAINLMIWDWYPRATEDGLFDAGFFANRAIELGFLGKEELGGPPVETNRFAETMPFAVMWTNHAPHNRLGEGLCEYTVDQFFSQPNYYRIDGKPLLVLWSVADLVRDSGGEEQARSVMDRLRRVAAERGLPGVYVAAVNGINADLERLGIDGATGYHYPGSGGYREEQRRVGDRAVCDVIEDYPTQTIPGHVRRWTGLADGLGRDYLLATTPMQNWEPTFRARGTIMQRHSPDAYREMLRRAKAVIDQRGLRPFVNIEAWNEWLEGSYMEPSTQWGYSYLEAVRDIFGKPEQQAP